MEYLDLYDSNRNLTGKKIVRDKKIISELKDSYINVVLVFIKNSLDKFLFQKTSKEKGSVIATTGGFVKSGSNSINTVFIEVSEELGIDISKDNIKLICTEIKDNIILDIYYLEKDINTSDLILQKEEVEEVFWLDTDEIKDLIKEDKIRKSNIKPFLDIINYLNK